MSNLIKHYSTATSGTVTISDTKQDVVLIHDATSLAITLTTTFPSNPIDGQRLTICSTLGVTTLTMSASNTIIGGLTTLTALGYGTWIFNSDASKWFRCG